MGTLNEQQGQLGATKATSIEQATFEREIDAMRYTRIPTNHQIRIAYDGSNNVEYVGFAPRGLATSASTWLIKKLTYTGVYPTTCLVAYGNWDARATYTYT